MKKFFRITVILIGIGLLLLFLEPLWFGVFNVGSICGIFMGFAVLGYGIALEKLNMFLRRLWERKWGMALLVFVLVLVAVILMSAGYLLLRMNGAADNPPDKATTVVVLGCQVKDDGPGILLKERVMTAKRFLEENPDIKCILSGGKGDDEPISEAECMKQMLVEEGINPERLYVEDKSTSTRENIEFSKKIIEQYDLEPKITIITSDFHQYRASKIAESFGMECFGVSAKTPTGLFATYYLREVGGILLEMLIGY